MKSKLMRIPREFEFMIDRLAVDISKATGYPKNRSAAMRKLAEANDRIIYKNHRIDWRII